MEIKKGGNMHSKKVLLATVFVVFALFGSTAAATDWAWYECTITKIGIGGGRYEFQISGTGISGTTGEISGWYEIHPNALDLQKEILAVVLTAISLDKKVEICLQPGVTKSIYAIYMK